MNKLLVVAFLFYLGAQIGWLMEFVFRNLISHSGPKMAIFINPGFCRGPYLPIYGIGVVVMFIISYLVSTYASNPSVILVVLGIGLAMTLIEFVGGVFLLRVCNLRLWDYRDEWGNIMGVICPTFSLIWTLLGGIFYIFIYPLCIDSIMWLANNLAFSFFVGFFYGIFIIDLATTNSIMKAIKDFGNEQNVVVKYEELKHRVQQQRHELQLKKKFFNQTYLDNYNIKNILEELEEIKEDKSLVFKSKRGKKK